MGKLDTGIWNGDPFFRMRTVFSDSISGNFGLPGVLVAILLLNINLLGFSSIGLHCTGLERCRQLPFRPPRPLPAVFMLRLLPGFGSSPLKASMLATSLSSSLWKLSNCPGVIVLFNIILSSTLFGELSLSIVPDVRLDLRSSLTIRVGVMASPDSLYWSGDPLPRHSSIVAIN